MHRIFFQKQLIGGLCISKTRNTESFNWWISSSASPCMNSLYEDIKNADRAITKNEQQEHINSLDRTVSTLIRKHGTENLLFLSSIAEHVSNLKDCLGKNDSPLQISPNIISAFKAASEHPVIQKSTKKTYRVPLNSRTLFDFV